ncbi:MAG: nitroreductase family deazaflavin-dependent oxidoreductase [Acidimicrobiia bacterium]|nr:nitroreductase family deazaflavin-dependent oxidoreductase [Acidimicrobiia bacterium]
MRAFWRFHRYLLRLTRGRWFNRIGPGRQLLLTTRGRKTGQPRSVGLSYMVDGDRWIVVGSNAGEDQHPAWWLNLLSEPTATIVVSGASLPVTAHELEEPERAEVFSRFVSEVGESYLEYQQRTTRRLPVVALTRTTM